MNELAQKSYDIKDQEIKNLYIEQGNLIINGGIENLNYNEAKVVKTKINGIEFTSLNIAVTGRYSKLSNLNLIFNDNNKFISYTETLLYEDLKTGKFIIDNYQNGKMVDHKLTEVKYINYEKINEELEGLKQISANLKTRSIGDKEGI